jgi:hypothetical protein
VGGFFFFSIKAELVLKHATLTPANAAARVWGTNGAVIGPVIISSQMFPREFTKTTLNTPFIILLSK